MICWMHEWMPTDQSWQSVMQPRGAASGISWINQAPVNHLHMEKCSNIAWSSGYWKEAKNVTFVKWNPPLFKVELMSFLRTLIVQTKWHLLAKFGPWAACLLTSDRAQLPLSTLDSSSGPPFKEVPPGHLHLDGLLDSQNPQIHPDFTLLFSQPDAFELLTSLHNLSPKSVSFQSDSSACPVPDLVAILWGTAGVRGAHHKLVRAWRGLNPTLGQRAHRNRQEMVPLSLISG